MHNNKPFSKSDYDKYHHIAVAKIIEFFRHHGLNAYQVQEAKQHWDVIVERQRDDGTQIVIDKFRVEGECRDAHYDDLYAGRYKDVHFPKRKCFKDCDGPNEREDLPQMIFCMSADPNDRRYIIALDEGLRRGLPKMYRQKNVATNWPEWFVPVDKNDCERWRIEDNEVICDGIVPADATNI